MTPIFSVVRLLSCCFNYTTTLNLGLEHTYFHLSRAINQESSSVCSINSDWPWRGKATPHFWFMTVWYNRLNKWPHRAQDWTLFLLSLYLKWIWSWLNQGGVLHSGIFIAVRCILWVTDPMPILCHEIAWQIFQFKLHNNNDNDLMCGTNQLYTFFPLALTLYDAQHTTWL